MSLSILVLAVTTQVGGYKDIPESHWAGSAVGNLVSSGYLPKGNGAVFQGEKPVTRFEFAVMMNRFINDMSRAFVRRPVKKTINSSKIKGKSEDGSQTAMLRLAVEGYLPYYSPILQGPSETITPEQFTVALGQVAQKLAWSFRTQDDGDAPKIGERKKKAEGGGGGGGGMDSA